MNSNDCEEEASSKRKNEDSKNDNTQKKLKIDLDEDCVVLN